MVQSAVSGVVAGGVYAVLGVCVVVLYRTVGVLNVAQAAIGAFGAFVTVSAFDGDVPLAAAAALGVLTGAGIGLLCGIVMATWFAEASAEVRSTVAIGILVTLLTLGFRVFGDSPRAVPDIVPDVSLSIGGVNVTGSGIAAVVGAIAIAGGVALLLARTDLGLRLRALAERPGTAELLGVPARRLAIAVWTVMGGVSALAVLVIAPSRTPDLLTLSLLIVPGLAAGLIGAFRSLGWTVAGGLAIGLVEGLCADVDAIAPYRDVAPFVIILVTLLWTQRAQVWDEAR